MTMVRPIAARRPPTIAITLISATALAYEVLLIRLFSIIQWHHFAYMIISLALLGYGASGTCITLSRDWLLARFPAVYIINALLFSFSTVACFLVAQQIPFNAEELLWDARQPLLLMALYLLLSLPFFFASNGIALALAHYRQAVSRIYAVDLLGAGLGSLGIVGLLFIAFPLTALRVLGSAAMLAAGAAWFEMRFSPRAASFFFAVPALLFLLVPDHWLTLRISPYKGLPQALRIAGTRIVTERSSPLGLLTVVESPLIPWRHAPGLSIAARDEPPAQLGLFTDGDNLTVITRNTGAMDSFGYLDQVPSALPYHLAAVRHVLVLGAGGGADVLQALFHDAGPIEAVELNGQIIDLVGRQYDAYAGHLYTSRSVTVHEAEARGFVTGSADSYDLIQIAMLDSFAASAAGLLALNESYLYTVEALQQYLRHLAPGGMLAVSRWLKLPPRDTLKLFATAVAALRENGVIDPQSRLILIRGWQSSTLLVKNGPFTAQQIAQARRFCAERLFDPAYYPGMTASEANQYNVLPEPFFFNGATALLGPDRQSFMERYKFKLSPATDDRPFFFNFQKLESMGEMLALRHMGGMPLLEWGYIVLIATLLQAVLLSILLIVLPLLVFLQKKAIPAGPARRGVCRIFVYFFSIGIAFLFLEIAFIQKFILFLPHPLYAVTVVLAAFLLFSGLGSACSPRVAAWRGCRQAVRLAVGGIIGLVFLYLSLLPPLFAALAALPPLAKSGLAVLLIAPLALCMGMPFPLAMAELGSSAAGLMPWAWGINGCASVISAALATVLAIHYGFTAVVLLACLLYGVAAVSFLGRNAAPGMSF